MSDDKVTSFTKAPHRVTPEMTIRWLMSQMDQFSELIVIAKKNGNAPIVSVTTETSPYLLAMGAALLHDLAVDGIEPTHRSSYVDDPPPDEKA